MTRRIASRRDSAMAAVPTTRTRTRTTRTSPFTPLLLLMAVAPLATASAMPSMHIFADGDDRGTCKAQGRLSCPSALPHNFCCAKGTTCLAVAGDTTALCCPEGSSCDKVFPITCDIDQQRVGENPNAPIKTTVFDVKLAKCGDKCCPFGFTCNDDASNCIMNKDQSEKPSEPQPSTTSATLQPTSTGTEAAPPPSKSTGSNAAPDQSSGSGSVSTPNGPDTTTIIGGVVGGFAVILAIAIIAFICVRRRRHRHLANAEKGPASTTSSFGNVISEPISQPGSYRTDFMLKTPSTHTHSVAYTDQGRFSSVPRSAHRSVNPHISNPFFGHDRVVAHSPTSLASSSTDIEDDGDDNDSGHGQAVLRTGHVVRGQLAPIRSMKSSRNYSRHPPATSANNQPTMQREPSSESINVFADPDTMDADDNDRRKTTFSDMMAAADLGAVHKGRRYVPGTTPRI